MLLLLYLGIGCSALAFILCGYGLARIEAGQGAVFGNLKPLVGVVLAVVLLGESLIPGHLGEACWCCWACSSPAPTTDPNRQVLRKGIPSGADFGFRYGMPSVHPAPGS